MTHAFRIHNRWALGDTICLAALARDLVAAYPGKYEVYFSGNYSGVFWGGCPFAKASDGKEKAQIVDVEYLEGIRAAGRGSKKHFLSWFHHCFEQRTGVKVPVTEAKGWAPLKASATKERPFPYRYWVIVAGGKMDMTAKVWYSHRWQEVVDALGKQGIRCVQAGARFNQHFQPTLQGVEQCVEKTKDERDFFRLIYHAEGVMCGITGAMHAAAAFNKPCVVVAGGREEPWWEAYLPESFTLEPSCAKVKVPHRFLHTVGLLDCGCGNLTKGCWKDRVVPIEQADLLHEKRKRQLCVLPIRDNPQQTVPTCLHMITTEMVIEAVLSYYLDGTLPPPGKSASIAAR